MARRATPRISWVLLVLVVAALATGAAASILVTSSKAPAPSPGQSQLVYLSPAWITFGSGVVIALFVATFVLWGLAGRRGPALNRMAATALVVVLLALVFIYLAHEFGPPGILGGGSGTQHNQTPPPPTCCGKVINGSGGVVTWPGFPPWLPFVVVAAVSLLVVAVAIPELRSYLADRRLVGTPKPGGSGAEARRLQDALARASAALESGGDPREVILALYAAMLARLQRLVMELDVSTPEEIRAAHLVRLGVRPEAAVTLTRLFEEARYSSHAMGRDASLRARDAVRAAMDDLDRRNLAA
jgi:hypothetical protein